MTKVRLLVSLKIPDTTAITAFHTLERMGLKPKSLEREDYYEFDVLKDSDRFMQEIVKADILVNANKHTAAVYKEQVPKEDLIRVLVTDSEDNTEGLMQVLKERLGFTDIAGMKRGVLWKINVDDKKAAEKITRELLMNENYQDFQFL